MWKRYQVKLAVEGQFASALPKTKEEIEAMLENRMPNKKPENAVPFDDLVEQVESEIGVEPEFGWATFKRDDNGLYYEGRCVRGHIKDCAQQLAGIYKTTIPNFKAKIANKVYVEDDKIYLGKDTPDGTEKRFIQVMTRQGPRSTYKYIDYVESPTINFVLRIFDDGVIDATVLRDIFEYGGTHGLGQERSQGWGRYTLAKLEEIS